MKNFPKLIFETLIKNIILLLLSTKPNARIFLFLKNWIQESLIIGIVCVFIKSLIRALSFNGQTNAMRKCYFIASIHNMRHDICRRKLLRDYFFMKCHPHFLSLVSFPFLRVPRALSKKSLIRKGFIFRFFKQPRTQWRNLVSFAVVIHFYVIYYV